MKRSLRKILSIMTAAVMLLTSGIVFSRSTTAEAEHTVLQQWDSEWGSYPYGDGTLQNSGCGAFAVINAVRYLTGYTMDIYEVADWASANEYIWGVGSAFTIAPHAAERYGSTYGFQTDTHYFFSNYVDRYYPASNEAYDTIWNMLVTKLSAGEVAVGLVHNHFIAIVDYDPSTQKVLVYDPGAGKVRGTTVNGDWKSKDDLNYWSDAGSSYLKLRAYLTFYFNTGTASGTPVYTTASTEFSGSADAAGTYIVSTDGGSLNLRSYASTSGEVITKMPDGAEVQVIESDGSWALVTYNGINGYCSMDYLTAVSESTDSSETSSTTTTESTTTTAAATTESLSEEFAGDYIVSAGGSYLNMRSGMSTSKSIVAQIPDGSEVTVTAANDDWAAVEWNGKSGYCSMAYLVKAEETTASKTTVSTTASTTTTTITTTASEEAASTESTSSLYEETEASSETETETTATTTETTTTETTTVITTETTAETTVSEPVTSETQEEPVYRVYTVNTDGAHLNLRSSGSMNGDILAQIPNGSSVLAAYYDGDWMRVTWNDIEGFCKVDYLSKSIASILAGSSAVDHSYKTTYGDVNIDNQITMADVVILHKSLSGAISLNMTSAANADCYMDGKLTYTDAAVIIQFILQNNTIPMKPIG